MWWFGLADGLAQLNRAFWKAGEGGVGGLPTRVWLSGLYLCCAQQGSGFTCPWKLDPEADPTQGMCRHGEACGAGAREGSGWAWGVS